MANEKDNRDRQARDENTSEVENTNTNQTSGQKDTEERDMMGQDES